MPHKFHQCYQLFPILPAGTPLDRNMHWSSEKGHITVDPHFQKPGGQGRAGMSPCPPG